MIGTGWLVVTLALLIYALLVQFERRDAFATPTGDMVLTLAFCITMGALLPFGVLMLVVGVMSQ